MTVRFRYGEDNNSVIHLCGSQKIIGHCVGVDVGGAVVVIRLVRLVVEQDLPCWMALEGAHAAR